MLGLTIPWYAAVRNEIWAMIRNGPSGETAACASAASVRECGSAGHFAQEALVIHGYIAMYKLFSTCRLLCDTLV